MLLEDFYIIEEWHKNKQWTQDLRELIIERHKMAFENWSEGELTEWWKDEQNNLCIRYDSGKWWRYKVGKYGLEW